MIIHQVSVFLENRAGQTHQPVRALAEAGVNIRTAQLADTEQFGIMRLIVDDWQKAKDVLEAADCVVKINEVLAVEVSDQPGGLDKVLSAIDDAGLNIQYMYAFTFGREGKAVLIFRFDDATTAADSLKERGLALVSPIDIYEQGK